jgi:hypothetical protein
MVAEPNDYVRSRTAPVTYEVYGAFPGRWALLIPPDRSTLLRVDWECFLTHFDRVIIPDGEVSLKYSLAVAD